GNYNQPTDGTKKARPYRAHRDPLGRHGRDGPRQQHGLLPLHGAGAHRLVRVAAAARRCLVDGRHRDRQCVLQLQEADQLSRPRRGESVRRRAGRIERSDVLRIVDRRSAVRRRRGDRGVRRRAEAEAAAHPAVNPRGHAMKKVYPDAASALKGLLRDNMTIASGGFGLCGIPEHAIQALVESGVKGLTIIGNNAGVDDFGMGLLLKSRQVKKVIASYVGENKEFERQVLAGELDLQLTPQGTLAEKLRAGGAGIPGFYTRTAAGTKLADGKDTRTFDGREYVLEPCIRSDVSIVKAWKGDKSG